MKKLAVLLAIVAVALLLTISFKAQAQQPSPAIPDANPRVFLPMLFSETVNLFTAEISETCNAQPEWKPLVAGQHYDTGEVKVWFGEEEMPGQGIQKFLYVQYITKGDWCLKETHVHVATSVDGIPQHNGNPAPGQFDYKADHKPCVKEYLYKIPVKGEWDDGDTLYIATHAIVTNTKSGQTETAWGFCYDFDGKNWARYCTYFIPKEFQVDYDLTLGYEDLPDGIAELDYDYNDMVVQVKSDNTYCDFGPDPDGNPRVGLAQIDYEFTPEARGARWLNRWAMLFPANTFLSDGTYELTIFDGSGAIVSNQSGPFPAAMETDLDIIEGADALPEMSNTFETSPKIPVNRTATMSIKFNEYKPFDLSLYPLDAPGNVHAEGLYFDPHLHVESIPPWPPITDEYHRGNDRILVVPGLDWMWPEERAGIWLAYPAVTDGGTPVFPANWWTTSTNCVYGDGIVCSAP